MKTAIDWAKWDHLYDHHYPPVELSNPPGCMDRRHVEMIHALLVLEQPASVVEIGCFNGFSTVAIVEAWATGAPLMRVDLVDYEIRHTVFKMVQDAHKPSGCCFRCCNMSSGLYTGTPVMWIIDGDHGQGAISDYGNAKQSDAEIIVLHDTNAAVATKHSFGSVEAGRRLQQDARSVFCDDQARPGEWTERGLMIGFNRVPKPETLQRLWELSE